MVTNGLLLSEQSPAVLATLRETGILVSISRHNQEHDFVAKQNAGIAILDCEGIRHEIRPSFTHWNKYYRLEDDKILPYNSDPGRAWKNCCIKHRCMTLMDNNIYKCSQVACLTRAFRLGILGSEWQPLHDYCPLVPESPDDEMRKFVKGQPSPVCQFCAEQYEMCGKNEKRRCVTGQ